MEDFMGAATSKRPITDALAYCVVISQQVFGDATFRDYVKHVEADGDGEDTLGLGVLVVSPGLAQELLGLVDQLPGLGRHLARFGLLDEILGLLDHDGAGIGPGRCAGKNQQRGYEPDDGSHASFPLIGGRGERI